MGSRAETVMLTQVFNATEFYNNLMDIDNVDTLDIALARWFLMEDTVNRNVRIMNLDEVFNKDLEVFEAILEFAYINKYKFNLKEFTNIGFIPEIFIDNLNSLKSFDMFIPVLGDSQVDTIKRVDELIPTEYSDKKGKIQIYVDINTEVNAGDMSILMELRNSNLKNFHIPNDIYFSMIENKDALAVVKYIKKLEERNGKYDQLVIDTKNCPNKITAIEVIEVMKTCYINGIVCDITSDVHSFMTSVYEGIYAYIKDKLYDLLDMYGNRVIITDSNFSDWHTAEFHPINIEGRQGIVIKEPNNPISERGLKDFGSIDMNGIEKISSKEKFISIESFNNGIVRVIPECMFYHSENDVDVDWKYVFN